MSSPPSKSSSRGRLGIVASGGPAPGINSVIAAATIRAELSGYEVVGIQDGYRWLKQGDISRVTPLAIANTSRIHFRGGSYIGVSRESPLDSEQTLATTIDSLKRLGVDKLITIGGEGTAYCSYRIAEATRGDLRVVHVPKTIDNDIQLPKGSSSFGYQTARHVGVDVVRNLMVDARTTSRWFFVVAMGRKAGHLALGIGKSAGATLTLIPEEFDGPDSNAVIDILTAAIVKRAALGRHDGVAVLAEGLADFLDLRDLSRLGIHEDNPKENVRVARLQIGHILKDRVEARLAQMGLNVKVVAKHIGYELRCADPTPFDMEYTRDLGYGAAKYLLEGGSHKMMTVQEGRLVPVPLDSIVSTDGTTNRTRLVDISSDRYQIARSYMIRLRAEDLEDEELLARMAEVAGVTPQQFIVDYGHLVADGRGRNSIFLRARGGQHSDLPGEGIAAPRLPKLE